MADSHAETMVTKIKSLLENRADSDIAQYTINGRSITKLSPKELTDWLRYYEGRVAEAAASDSLAAGTGNSKTVKVRF